MSDPKPTDFAFMAVLTGVFLGILAGAAAALGDIPQPWTVGLMAASLSAALAWLYLISWWRSVIEGMHGIERTQNLQTVSTETAMLSLSIDWDDGHAGLWADLETERDKFICWAIGVANGKSLGENHWTGAAGIFSKSEYHAMRDGLEYYGLIRPAGKHHSQGYALSGKGRAICSEIARRYSAAQSFSPTHPNYPELTARA